MICRLVRWEGALGVRWSALVALPTGYGCNLAKRFTMLGSRRAAAEWVREEQPKAGVKQARPSRESMFVHDEAAGCHIASACSAYLRAHTPPASRK